MTGRRRHDRFAVTRPWEGALRVLWDVTVCRTTDEPGMTVASAAPGALGEFLMLDIWNGMAESTLTVRVTASRPVMVGEAVHHALSLAVLDGDSAAAHGRAVPSTKVGLTGSDAVLMLRTESFLANDLDRETFGVLSRQVRVRALNLSGSGCLLESDRRVEPGTTATLRLAIGDQEFTDGVRVTWCRRIAGAGETWRSGAEFLWSNTPNHRSLRHAANRLRHRFLTLQETGRIESPRLM